jgi:hypothetical protein
MPPLRTTQHGLLPPGSSLLLLVSATSLLLRQAEARAAAGSNHVKAAPPPRLPAANPASHKQRITSRNSSKNSPCCLSEWSEAAPLSPNQHARICGTRSYMSHIPLHPPAASMMMIVTLIVTLVIALPVVRRGRGAQALELRGDDLIEAAPRHARDRLAQRARQLLGHPLHHASHAR